MNTLKLDNWPLMEISASHPEVIRTNSGKYINLLNPHEDDININDINEYNRLINIKNILLEKKLNIFTKFLK